MERNAWGALAGSVTGVWPLGAADCVLVVYTQNEKSTQGEVKMAEKKKVVVAAGANFTGRELIKNYLLTEYPDAIVDFVDILPEKEFIQAAQGAEVVLSQHQKMSERIYEALPELRAFCAIGIGFNAADVPAATRHGVIVTNVPDYCTDEVASHTVALILAMQRGLYKQVPWIKDGHWDIKAIIPRRRFKDSTVGLFGFGGIARNVARKLSGFEVNIIACDPYVSPEQAAEYNAQMVEWDELIERSDILSLHAPLLPSTKGKLNEEALRRMKPHAYVVNCARGELIDREALYKALTENWIAGAALDVVYNEPVPDEFDKKLIALPNIWATGHSAFYSVEAYDELMRKAANEAGRALRGEKPRCCVNKEVLAHIKWFAE